MHSPFSWEFGADLGTGLAIDNGRFSVCGLCLGACGPESGGFDVVSAGDAEAFGPKTNVDGASSGAGLRADGRLITSESRIRRRWLENVEY